MSRHFLFRFVSVNFHRWRGNVRDHPSSTLHIMEDFIWPFHRSYFIPNLVSRLFLPIAEGTCRGPCGFNPHGIRQVPSAVDRPNLMRMYFMGGHLNYCHNVFFPFRLNFTFPTRNINRPMWSYFLASIRTLWWSYRCSNYGKQLETFTYFITNRGKYR